MTGIADNAPAAGGFLLTVLYAIGHIIVWYSKRLRKRDEAAMVKVPPSPQLQPPQIDHGVLARLDCMDAANAMSVELHHTRSTLDERDRRIRELERENADLVTRLKIADAAKGIADSLLRAREEHIAWLQEDLAKERTRRRGGVIEVSEAEYRDASQAGPLADALPTPLRPPRR